MKEVMATQIAELKKLELETPRSDELIQHIGGVSITAITGPSCVGKSTIVNASGLYKVPGFTTRPERVVGEEGIRFIKHEKTELDEIIDQAKSGGLVQLRVSGEGYVYGTTQADFIVGEPNIVDMHARSIDQLDGLGFKEITKVVIVSPPDEWLSRFEAERGSVAQNADRLWDDLDSLRWATEGSNDVFIPIINREGTLNATVDSFRDIALNGLNNMHVSTTGYTVASDMISTIAFLASS